MPHITVLSEISFLETLIAANLEQHKHESLTNIRLAFSDVIARIVPTNAGVKEDLELFLRTMPDNDKESSRLIGTILIRYLSVESVIPNNSENNGVEFTIVSFLEKNLPDFMKKFGVTNAKLSYEKFNILRGIHNEIVHQFDSWLTISPNIEGLISNKNIFLRSINSQIPKAYLSAFGIGRVSSSVNELFEHLEIVSKKDENFHETIEKIKTITELQKDYLKNNRNFFNDTYYSSFIHKIQEATNKLEKESFDIFRCDISPVSQQPYIASKKYPLQEVGREFLIRIPLQNTGPGLAKDVEIHFFEEEKSSISLNSKQNIGNIRAGLFEIAIEALILEPSTEASFGFIISWRQQNSPTRKERTETCIIQAQKSDIDWNELAYEEPYSTEVAEGDEFIGRSTKLESLLSRLLKAKMQSTYITGQKRVGKTSLAKATISRLENHSRGSKISSHYVEWGEVAKPDPQSAVQSLGLNIARFLKENSDIDIDLGNFDFTGSISSLNEIATKIKKLQPELKFLIVIDEFDEIHPEMYRYGLIAETFFSNLRTLSSKPNIGFMLVGGENMPFVLNAQGDQLNRFVSESVDYFSELEYTDYEELVRKPTNHTLTWSNGALRELFYITNGHPFYTKIICSQVFDTAVQERDAEITEREISLACTKLSEDLDVNSFAHLWRDSIQKTEAEAESIILNRCRCLVSIGICLREGARLTASNIYEKKKFQLMDKIELNSHLNDFVRRNILVENGGEFSFKVPLFGKWLVNKGIRILISDFIGDEMASAKILSDERLRVTESEIEKLARSWHPYRGQEISTEKIRHWICQVDSIEDQRLLFKILSHVKFYSEIDIRQKLKIVSEFLKTKIPVKVMTSKQMQRSDIIISYADGEGKSGQYYASKYADESRSPARCIIPEENFTERAIRHELKDDVTVNAIVFIDDIAATGNTLSENIKRFVEKNEEFIKQRSLLVLVVALVATPKGEQNVNREIQRQLKNGFSIELRICELLSSSHISFGEDNKNFWDDETEMAKARSLCLRIGSSIASKAPLGYQDSGLLVVFPDRCPNNSLPVLHSKSTKEKFLWTPLFERPLK